MTRPGCPNVRYYHPNAHCRLGWTANNVFPDLHMVVVFTGGNYVGEVPGDEIITRFILPAVE